ncbi:MAG: VWA domain-containing protein [Candidatus Babeliales bacterium]
MLLRFAYSAALLVTIPVLITVIWYRLMYYKGVVYRYPLTTTLAKQSNNRRHIHTYILFALRALSLTILALLVGKPQLVDSRSHVMLEGIDIIVVLDVSGSMGMPHHAGDERSRIDVAKEEAIRFIDKRTNDAIGLVIFGSDAVSRCPLTADKVLLKSMIHDIEIGVINPEGTVVATSIIAAANRLKQSHAASKIMILLTDGEPSEHDADPEVAITIAQQLGIKIYTVGIGDDQEVLVQHPLYGRIPMRTTLNKGLLTTIAHRTGGQFFEAKNAQDMRTIYDTIDRLERAPIDTPIFSNYYDIFMPFIWALLLLLLGELLARSLIWLSL